LVTSCVGNAFRNIIEGRIEGRIEMMEDEEEAVRSYWMILRKREGAVN